MPSESFVGWSVLDRSSLKFAQALMQDDEEGVRDELGLNVIRSAYANEFFPGTASQQTHPRYVLFIPWIFESLARQAALGTPVDGAIEFTRSETQLTRRLAKADQKGIIGGRSESFAPVRPASSIYWSALRLWEILRPVSGRFTVRDALVTNLQLSPSGQDDDKAPLNTGALFDPELPGPPPVFKDTSKSLTFSLRRVERDYLLAKLGTVSKPDLPREHSLLAQLVKKYKSIPETAELYDTATFLARRDRPKLLRAKHAASLGAMCRAFYNAFVESTYNQLPNVSARRHHTDHLTDAAAKHAAGAMRCNLDELEEDVPRLRTNPALYDVLVQTQAALRKRPTSSGLREYYAYAEEQTKATRSKLQDTRESRDRCALWEFDRERRLAQPFNYRWPIVQDILRDLRESARRTR